MITHSDEGPEFEPDDPLAVILRPPSDRLAPPPGHYEAIRRTAARRRLLRATAGVGAACAVAALIAVPLRLALHESSSPPAVPLAPPPATGPLSPSPSPSPESATTRPSVKTPSGTATPSDEPSAVPTSPAEPSALPPR